MSLEVGKANETLVVNRERKVGEEWRQEGRWEKGENIGSDVSLGEKGWGWVVGGEDGLAKWFELWLNCK